jgi:hypothetical protein
VYNAAGTLQTAAPHVVQGLTASLAKGTTGLTVTLTGSAVFTSATSYVCTANEAVVADDPISVINNSGTSFTLYNDGEVAGTTTIYYNCIGH